jgi:hypothetical protein
MSAANRDKKNYDGQFGNVRSHGSFKLQATPAAWRSGGIPCSVSPVALILKNDMLKLQIFSFWEIIAPDYSRSGICCSGYIRKPPFCQTALL